MKQVFNAIEKFNEAVFDEGLISQQDKKEYYLRFSRSIVLATKDNASRLLMDYHCFSKDQKPSVPEFMEEAKELPALITKLISKLDLARHNITPSRVIKKFNDKLFDDITNFNEAIFDEGILPRDMEEKYYKYLRYWLIKTIQEVSNWDIKYHISKTKDLDRCNAIIPKLIEKLETEAGYIDLTYEELEHYEKTLFDIVNKFKDLADAFQPFYLR